MGAQDKYTSVFPTRLRKLIEERKTTITAVAKALNISRQAVSLYADGSTQPNIDKLVEIARFFNVSSDYLIGLSDYERKSTEEITASDMGISEEAAKQLATHNAPSPEFTGTGSTGYVLSIFAESPKFINFCSAVVSYMHCPEFEKDKESVSYIRSFVLRKSILTEYLFQLLDDYINFHSQRTEGKRNLEDEESKGDQ